MARRAKLLSPRALRLGRIRFHARRTAKIFGEIRDRKPRHDVAWAFWRTADAERRRHKRHQ